MLAYPGWTLTDARALTPHERHFFISRASERAERRALQQ